MPQPILSTFYEQLSDQMGPQHWWPADKPWEVALGAVLTQNTNWKNVEQAIAALRHADAIHPQTIADLPHDDLAQLIRPSGTHNTKARRLHAVATWWIAHATDGFNPTYPTDTLRRDLLAIHGVGPETADCILLYAFQRPIFVIDAYARRWLQRHQLAHAKETYDQLQARFMEQIPPDPVIYNEYHALIIALGKTWCQATPKCDSCPLRWHLT